MPALGAAQPVQKIDPATGRISVFAGGQYVDTGNVDPNWHPPAIATAAGQIAAGTAAGTYHAPMTAAEQSASRLALSDLAERSKASAATLAETTRAAQAGESLTGLGITTGASTSAASLAEQKAEAAAANTLATNKFNQTKSDRSAALTALQGLWSGGGPGAPGAPGGTGVPTGGVTPETGWQGGTDPGGIPTGENAAEAAALTSSKERGGEQLASSLKALRDFNGSAGGSRVGSGLEAHDARNLFAANLQGQNDTERGIVAGRVQRAQDLSDAARQRQAQVEDRNFAAQQALQKSYLDSLLSVYGMGY